MSEWLIVGGSNGVYDYIDPLLSRCEQWITTNSGYMPFLTCNDYTGPADRLSRIGTVLPHIYWISDPRAYKLHRRAIRFMWMRGVDIRTVSRHQGVREITSTENIPERPDAMQPFTRGAYQHPRFSGLICLQIAVNHGARRVHCLGMEGYRSANRDLVVDSFDGRLGKDRSAKDTRNWIEPFTQSVIDACPGVEFTFYGNLAYSLHGDNVRLIPGVVL